MKKPVPTALFLAVMAVAVFFGYKSGPAARLL